MICLFITAILNNKVGNISMLVVRRTAFASMAKPEINIVRTDDRCYSRNKKDRFILMQQLLCNKEQNTRCKKNDGQG